MKTVVYTCPFVPAEWIAAHGMRPSRVLARSDGARRFDRTSAGICSYAAAFVRTVCSDDAAAAVVVTTMCDQMRRSAERIAVNTGLPVFLMNVPSTWQTAVAHELYLSELKRLGRFLARLGGAEPSPQRLAEVMVDCDARRTALRAAAGRLSARGLAEAIARFHLDGAATDDTQATPRCLSGVPIALVGGPLVPHHFPIFDLVERFGGNVALDATESGERTLPGPFDRSRLKSDPLRVLADAYFRVIPDPGRRPNTEFYLWLERRLTERAIRGVIVRYYLWCDKWHAEAQRIKERARIPVIAIEEDADQPISAHTASRVQALVEMLT